MANNRLNKRLFDLTHLEINTIVKSNMTASKVSNKPRMLLYEIAKIYHLELVFLGKKYSIFIDTEKDDTKELFRGSQKYKGCGYKSFNELEQRAEYSIDWLDENKSRIIEIDENELLEDKMMLERVRLNCNEIRSILKRFLHSSSKKEIVNGFDDPEKMEEYRQSAPQEKNKKYDIQLELEDLLSLKKMVDIGTERILTQTVISLQGDVTTRIARTFADNPNTYISETHQEAIKLSVNYWTTLVNILSGFISNLVKNRNRIEK